MFLVASKIVLSQDPNGRRVRVNYARERLRPGEFCAYSVPSSYHGSHIKISYAADGEISKRTKDGPLRCDYERNIVIGDFQLLNALNSISKVITVE